MPWCAGETMAKPGAPLWNTRRYVVRYVEHPVGAWNIADAWDIAGAWDIAVHTRGVFTHRAGFLKPACVERGLVRTANQPLSQLRQLTLSDFVRGTPALPYQTII